MATKFNSLKERYLYFLSNYSDMQEYLPSLLKIASKVKHITEFGVNIGVSTCAFLCSKPDKMISYDIKKEPEVDELIELTVKEKINFEFKLDNDLFIEIEPTELLFIDTLHNYNQMKAELMPHANKVSKYIVFHDVIQYGIHGHTESTMGIGPAIREFLRDHVDWQIVDFREDGAGLLILEKNPNYDLEIGDTFDKMCDELNRQSFKYFLIVSDRLCKNTKVRVRSGDTLVSTFVMNVLRCFAKWIKQALPIFNMRVLVINKKNGEIIIDSR